jgi:hypothetical protein
MLALAGEVAGGAVPAGRPPDFTAQARQVLGPDKLLVIALPVAADTEPDRAIAATAREHRTAGADHVILMLPPGGQFAAGVHQREQLAPALRESQPLKY